MAIEFKNATHTYLSETPMLAHKAMDNVTLTINEGEFVAITGHTGSGKSTLITHMNALLLPTSGNVIIDGMNTAEKEQRKKIRSLVGLVFQYPEYQLFDETVASDIAFGPKNMGLVEAEINERVHEAMELVGLDYDKFSKKSPFELSGGEKRRAALAGVLAMRPKYLVLDEPMAGLDPSGRRYVMQTISSLREKTGCAIIMISHSMDDVANNAERIIVMENGKILLDGAPEYVFSFPDKLKATGLGLPHALELSEALKKRGIDVPSGIYDTELLCQYLIGRLCS